MGTKISELDEVLLANDEDLLELAVVSESSPTGYESKHITKANLFGDAISTISCVIKKKGTATFSLESSSTFDVVIPYDELLSECGFKYENGFNDILAGTMRVTVVAYEIVDGGGSYYTRQPVASINDIVFNESSKTISYQSIESRTSSYVPLGSVVYDSGAVERELLVSDITTNNPDLIIRFVALGFSDPELNTVIGYNLVLDYNLMMWEGN